MKATEAGDIAFGRDVRWCATVRPVVAALEHEIERLYSHAAAALERVEVEDCGEAEMILRQVVNLDGSPANRGDDEAGTPPTNELESGGTP